MTTAIILLLVFLLFLLWPRIIRWLSPMINRWAMRRFENYVRKAAGMPPPPKTERRKKNRQEPPPHNSRPKNEYYSDEPVIPREYAEDVEFTETVDYSSDRFTGSDGKQHTHTRIHTESQVSDVEWEDITGDRK